MYLGHTFLGGPICGDQQIHIDPFVYTFPIPKTDEKIREKYIYYHRVQVYLFYVSFRIRLCNNTFFIIATICDFLRRGFPYYFNKVFLVLFEVKGFKFFSLFFRFLCLSFTAFHPVFCEVFLPLPKQVQPF